MKPDDGPAPDGTIGYEPVRADDVAAPPADGTIAYQAAEAAPTQGAASPTAGDSRSGTARSAFGASQKSGSRSGTGSVFGRSVADAGVSPDALIGPYEVLDELGRGGMGVVYKARHVHLNRTVALKMIVGGAHLSPAHLERFRTEAEAVARLQHQNIVQVYDVGEHDGAPYIALEMVDGGNLARRIGAKPQAAKFAAQTVETLARAVHVAHQAGVVHRDLKPANVLLTLDGQPKVTDFGLAKNLEAGQGQTHAGSILGTPSYMAPEQAAGRVHDIGPPTDIYALGCILYELLTGHPPFRGDSPIATIRMVLDGEVVPPRQLVVGVPKDLDTICLKALQKPTHRRYATAEALAEDLRRFLDGEPILARPIGPAERFAKWVRRNPARAATLATGIVAAAAMLALGVWSYFAVTRRAEEAEAARVQAQEALAEGTRRMVRLNVANGTRHLDDGDYLSSALWFAEALRLEQGGPDREWVHRVRLHAVLHRCPRPAREWLHEGSLTTAGFDAAGKRVLAAGEDGLARVWDVATGGPAGPPLEHGGAVKVAALSPDGTTAVTAGADESLKFWDVAAGRVVVASATGVGTLAVAVSPDGRSVLTGGAAGRARVWDAATGAERFPPYLFAGPAIAVSWFPDGARYVAGSRDGTARVFDAKTGQPVTPPLKHGGPVLSVAVAPDGKRVATASADGTAQLWSATDGQPLLAAPVRHAADVLAVRFSPDGKRLLTGSDDRSAQIWDATTGLPVGRPAQHASRVHLVDFSPDGRWYATGSDDNSARVWEAATGEPLLPPFRYSATPVAVRFSPDGYHLLVAAQNRLAELWDLIPPSDLDPAPPASTAHAPTAGVQTVASPDGSLVVSFGGGQAVRVRRAADREPVTPPMRTGAAASAAAFSPDGSRVVTGDEEGAVMLWSAADGKPLWSSPARHASRMSALAFSQDGKALATGSEDNSARVWDAATGEPLTPPVRLAASAARVAFDPAGKLLYTVTVANKARVWDAATGEPLTPALAPRTDWAAELTPTAWPVDDLLAAGRLFAGQKLTATGDVLPLDPAELRDEQRKLAAKYPAGFDTPAAAVRAWRSAQASSAETAGEWFAAAWHLDRLLADDADDGDLRRRRAAAAAKLGDWKRAAGDAGRAVRAQPTNADNWYQRGVALGQLGEWDRAAGAFAQAVRLKAEPAAAVGLAALVALEAGDGAGYRRACRELLDRHRDAADLSAAWACALSPESGADPAALLKLAGDGTDPFALTVQAAALVRAGRSAEAVAKLKRLAAAEDRPATWLVYALALSKQGDAAGAKLWRAKAEAWLASVRQPGAVPPAWDRRAEVEVLLREVLK